MSYQLLSYGNVSVLFTLSCLFPTFNLFLWNKKGFCWEKNRFEKYFLNGRSAHLSPSHTGLWRRSQPCTVCCLWWLFELICPLGIWFPCYPTLPSSHDRIECAQGLRNQVARKLRHPRVIHQNYLPIQTAIKQTLYSGQISRNFITKLSCLVMENNILSSSHLPHYGLKGFLNWQAALQGPTQLCFRNNIDSGVAPYTLVAPEPSKGELVQTLIACLLKTHLFS